MWCLWLIHASNRIANDDIGQHWSNSSDGEYYVFYFEKVDLFYRKVWRYTKVAIKLHLFTLNKLNVHAHTLSKLAAHHKTFETH